MGRTPAATVALRDQILATVRSRGLLTTREVEQRIGTRHASVYRGLAALEQAGLITKVVSDRREVAWSAEPADVAALEELLTDG